MREIGLRNVERWPPQRPVLTTDLVANAALSRPERPPCDQRDHSRLNAIVDPIGDKRLLCAPFRSCVGIRSDPYSSRFLIFHSGEVCIHATSIRQIEPTKHPMPGFSIGHSKPHGARCVVEKPTRFQNQVDNSKIPGRVWLSLNSFLLEYPNNRSSCVARNWRKRIVYSEKKPVFLSPSLTCPVGVTEPTKTVSVHSTKN